jgi:hypothetical protein
MSFKSCGLIQVGLKRNKSKRHLHEDVSKKVTHYKPEEAVGAPGV